MAISNDGKINQVVNELTAFIGSLPSSNQRVPERYLADYMWLVRSLEALTDRDFSQYHISDIELKSAVDEFSQMAPRSGFSGLPPEFHMKKVDPERIRSLGSRLLSHFAEASLPSGTIVQHITITGDANQTTVGVAGGDLSQSPSYEVTSGQDDALLEGLKSIGLDSERIEELKTLLEQETDPDGKRSVVRKWVRTLTNEVLAGTISGAIVSQAPAAFAMALGYLS